MQPAEEDRAAELLERLLTDGEFRAQFRRNPAGACAAFDLGDLAREFGSGSGKSLHTLEIRESRSSLAGALMAAASEGAGGVESLRRMHEGSELHGGAHRVVHAALTNTGLKAVDPSAHEGLIPGGGGAAASPHFQEAASGSVAGVLDNPHLSLSPEAHAALVRGGADHRLVSVLEGLSADHDLRIGTLRVSHGAGGDSFDILSVDGQRVSQSNIAARDLANELASLDPSLRPAQIVTPWPIAGEGFSTHGGNDDRIHLVFGPATEPPASVGAQPVSAEQSIAPSPAAVSTADQPPPDPAPPPASADGSAVAGSNADPSAAPVDPGAAPAEPATPPADPTTTPAAGSGSGVVVPPADPTTPVPDPSATSPPPSTPPPEPATTPAPVGGEAVPVTPVAPPEPAAAPPPPEPTTSPPQASTVPPAPPEPTTPAPVEPSTTPAVAHQSVQLGAVGGGGSHGTLQIQVPDQAAGGQGRELLGASAGAFDPATAGGLPDASDTYPGDNAGQQAIAAWMARQAHKAGLPAELPIMAALTESGLKNDNYGDRDSLGFFQMRTSIWNQGEYAGFPDHPELQLKWFINQALAVRAHEVAGGNASFGQDRSKWGDWVADVEQPAAEYRGRYQTHLDQADGLLSAGGPGAAAGLNPTDPSEAAAALAGATGPAAYMQGGYSTAGIQALGIAEKFIGTPYHWGGDTPATGFDCSGLVEYSYAQLGIHIPRVAADQFNVGVPVTKDELQPGDIVFFKDSTGYVHHEGIYIGNDMFLHAPHTGDVVKISSLDEPYYAQQFAGGRDVTGLASGGAPAGADTAGAGPAGVAPAGAAPVDPAGGSGGAADPPADQADPAGGADAPSRGESGLFGAVGGSEPPPPGTPAPSSPTPPSFGGSTVQILPAVADPNESS